MSANPTEDPACVALFPLVASEQPRLPVCAEVLCSAALCGMADYEFYDTSEEATRRFLQAQAKEHTLGGKFPTIH